MRIVSKSKYKEIVNDEYRIATGLNLTIITLICFIIGGTIALIGLNYELSYLIVIGLGIIVGGSTIIAFVKISHDNKKIKLIAEKLFISHKYKDFYEVEIWDLCEKINKELDLPLSTEQIHDTQKVVFLLLKKKNIPVYIGVRLFDSLY